MISMNSEYWKAYIDDLVSEVCGILLSIHHHFQIIFLFSEYLLFQNVEALEKTLFGRIHLMKEISSQQ